LINFNDIDVNPAAEAYWNASSYVDPSRYLLSPKGDDNHELDLGLAELFADSNPGDDDGSVMSINLLCLDSLMLLDCFDEVLLMTCCNQLNSGSRALHALDLHLNELGTMRSQYYKTLHEQEALLACGAPVHAHMDGGA
jgi:hypothetical protein